MEDRRYICIDLKSFYASVECAERGLDCMTTRLVVADAGRSPNTICLAVSPEMKRLGVHNRCRLRDIPPGLDCIIATPRMQKYIDYSARIYGIYLSYIAAEDIHVYSIDEAFMDVTHYLKLYRITAPELGRRIMADIYSKLKIRATCGIGTNLYLTKIALDITAKHSPDFIGVLDEETYRKTLWEHRPLTDFWRIGRGIAARLAKYGIYTMGDIARTDENFLYRLFGVDAELLIDHAYGREPVTIADIKAYRSKSHSLSSGQVLMSDYSFEKGELIVREMTDALCLDMLRRGVVSQSFTLLIGYSSFDAHSFARGSCSVISPTNSPVTIVPAIVELYRQITDPELTIRRVTVVCNNIVHEEYHQLDFFTDTEANEKSVRAQQAMLSVQQRFGADAMLKGMNLEEGAMTITRNHQIGGHRSGT